MSESTLRKWLSGDISPEVVQERDFVLLHSLEIRRCDLEMSFAPAIDLTRSCSPEDLIKHGVSLLTTQHVNFEFCKSYLHSPAYHVVVAAAHLYVRNRKRVRVGPCSSPGHRERAAGTQGVSSDQDDTALKHS